MIQTSFVDVNMFNNKWMGVNVEFIFVSIGKFVYLISPHPHFDSYNCDYYSILFK